MKGELEKEDSNDETANETRANDSGKKTFFPSFILIIAHTTAAIIIIPQIR